MIRRSYVRGDGVSPRIIAHRGLSWRAPENTLAAVRLALDAEADMVEVDVHLTADDKVVAIHDRTLQRTTTGNGAVRSYTWDELSAFDAGSWFDPAFSSERIPMLSQILECVGPSTELNIEIKSYAFYRIDPHHLASTVLACVQNARAFDRVLFTSFDPEILTAIRELDRTATIGSLRSWSRNILRDPLTTVFELDASVFICSRQEFRRSFVPRLHERGTAIFIYTVNDPEEASRFAAAGVDGIITNAADRMAEITG